MKEKRPEETQTLCAGCSKAEPQIFAPDQTPFPRAGRPQFNRLESGDGTSLPLPTNPLWSLGEDRCTQFPVIVVTESDPPDSDWGCFGGCAISSSLGAPF